MAAAGLGAEVTCLVRLGADPLGDEAIAGYERDAIPTGLIIRDPTGPLASR